jgi:hypothetical protein
VTDRENALGRSLTSETPWRSARHVVSVARATAGRVAVGSPTPAPDRLPGAGERRSNPVLAATPGGIPSPAPRERNPGSPAPRRHLRLRRRLAAGLGRSPRFGGGGRPPEPGVQRSSFVRARRVRAGRRYGARWSRSSLRRRRAIGRRSPVSVRGHQRQRRREDLEGEQSPGRTCLPLSGSNPARRAHELVRWSKASRWPARPVVRTRPRQRGRVAIGWPPVRDVWRFVEQSADQSPSGAAVAPLAFARGVVGGTTRRQRRW